MITFEMKDRVLNAIVQYGMKLGINIHESEKEFSMNKDYLCAILDQFEKLELIEQSKMLGGTIFISVTANAHDFVSHGGFEGQENLLKNNIEKLLLEIESLKPSMPEKINELTSIAANIATALGLFFFKQ